MELHRYEEDVEAAPSSTLPNLVLGLYILLKYLEFMFCHLQGV